MKWSKNIEKYLPILLFAGQLSLALPLVRDHIGADKDLYAQVTAGAALVALYCINHLYLFGRKDKISANLEKLKDSVLEEYSNRLEETFKETGVTFRINVMFIKKKKLSMIEPTSNHWLLKRKLKLFTKHFIPVWSNGNMKHCPDETMVLTVNQGVAGLAYKKKDIHDSTCKEVEDVFFNNLNEDQRELTKDIIFIMSAPIKQEGSGKIIGVLNIDTLDEEFFKYYDDTEFMRILTDQCRTIARDCSYFFIG